MSALDESCTSKCAALGKTCDGPRGVIDSESKIAFVAEAIGAPSNEYGGTYPESTAAFGAPGYQPEHFAYFFLKSGLAVSCDAKDQAIQRFWYVHRTSIWHAHCIRVMMT